MTTSKRPIQNKYNLPPDLFELVCEKSCYHDTGSPGMLDPEDPIVIYDILLQEIEIQAAGAAGHPEEDGRFPTIMQCALILEHLRQDAAVKKGIICKECFEPLLELSDGAVCDNPKCSLYLKVRGQ